VSEVLFYVGLHQPADAHRFPRCCISINRLRTRVKPVGCPDVLLDSGAFTELHNYGGYRHAPAEYAADVRRLHSMGVVQISAAVAQDYMCEPFMLAKTGLTLIEHQRLTIERYDDLASEDLPVPVMPVLQGFHPSDYARHVRDYGDRLARGMWVGVGSVCKRQGDPAAIYRVLSSIKDARPDLRLHGFGVKATSLMHCGVRELLETADSMAWSFAARKAGRSPNDWREAKAFSDGIEAIRPVTEYQTEMAL
jgi:hypothetical protein